jgi:hypothetical protein
MIYVENDFYSNFSSAVQANDDATIHDMMIDQFSTLIARRRGEVIELLQKVGIALTKNPTNEEISNLIVSNLRKSKKLQAGLAYLIAKQNNILEVSEKSKRSNANGEEGEEEGKKVDWNATANTVTAIAGTIGVLADTLRGARAGEFQQNLQNQSNTKAPNYSGQAYGDQEIDKTSKKKKKKWLWIGLGVVAVAGVAYYGYKKGWFAGGKKELGGDVSGGIE